MLGAGSPQARGGIADQSIAAHTELERLEIDEAAIARDGVSSLPATLQQARP